MNTTTDYTTDKNHTKENGRTELVRPSKHSECMYGTGDKECKASFKCTYADAMGFCKI